MEWPGGARGDAARCVSAHARAHGGLADRRVRWMVARCVAARRGRVVVRRRKVCCWISVSGQSMGNLGRDEGGGEGGTRACPNFSQGTQRWGKGFISKLLSILTTRRLPTYPPWRQRSLRQVPVTLRKVPAISCRISSCPVQSRQPNALLASLIWRRLADATLFFAPSPPSLLPWRRIAIDPTHTAGFNERTIPEQCSE